MPRASGSVSRTRMPAGGCGGSVRPSLRVLTLSRRRLRMGQLGSVRARVKPVLPSGKRLWPFARSLSIMLVLGAGGGIPPAPISSPPFGCGGLLSFLTINEMCLGRLPAFAALDASSGSSAPLGAEGAPDVQDIPDASPCEVSPGYRFGCYAEAVRARADVQRCLQRVYQIDVGGDPCRVRAVGVDQGRYETGGDPGHEHATATVLSLH